MRKPVVILAAPCILNPGLQAAVPMGGNHWCTRFIELMGRGEIRVFSLPCTESDFCGVPRRKHGLDYYQGLKGYSEYCDKLALETARTVLTLVQEGWDVAACLGIEHSPSCAVSYLYTHRGTVKRAGIFFERLFTYLEELDIPVVKIGINRKYPRKAYARLREVLEWHG